MDQIKGIVFDKDGTLFDYQNTWADWCRKVLEELADCDPEVMAELAKAGGFDLASGSFLAGSIIVGGSGQEVNQVWADILTDKTYEDVEAIALKHLQNLMSFPVCDLRETLGALRNQGLKLGVATNDYEEGATL